MISAYPTEALGKFPIGDYQVINQIKYAFMLFRHFCLFQIHTFVKLNFANKKLVLPCSKPFIGIALVRILPPKNLQYPFLPYRNEASKVSYPLCHICAEQQERYCQHSDW